MDKFLYFLLGILALLFVACVVGQVKESNELKKQAIACEQNKATADYLKCLAPIRARQKQIQQDNDDAALISTMTALSVAAIPSS